MRTTRPLSRAIILSEFHHWRYKSWWYRAIWANQRIGLCINSVKNEYFWCLSNRRCFCHSENVVTALFKWVHIYQEGLNKPSALLRRALISKNSSPPEKILSLIVPLKSNVQKNYIQHHQCQFDIIAGDTDQRHVIVEWAGWATRASGWCGPRSIMEGSGLTIWPRVE